MIDAIELIRKLASRELYLKYFKIMNLPKPVIRRQKSALEVVRRKLEEYEARYGKVEEQTRKKVYLDYLTEQLGLLTLEQLKIQCDNCTHFYMNEFSRTEDFTETESFSDTENLLDETEKLSDSDLEYLLNEAEKAVEIGCPLHPGKPYEITLSEKCPDYTLTSAHAEEYNKKITEERIKIVKEFLEEIK